MIFAPSIVSVRCNAALELVFLLQLSEDFVNRFLFRNAVILIFDVEVLTEDVLKCLKSTFGLIHIPGVDCLQQDDVPYNGVNSRRRGATASVRKCDVTTQQTSEGTTRWLNLMLPYPTRSCQAYYN